MSYQNGKIYKLICSETGDIYIGSTTQTLKDRLSGHKTPSNTCTSKGFINPIIVLIKDFPCNTREELEAEERVFVKEVNCVNKQIPGRTNREYRLDNKDRLKEYRLDNKDKIKQRNKQYSLKNKDKIKQYYLDNAEKKKENDKQYRLDNAEKIKEKFNCECGGKFTRQNKIPHFKTKKHIKFLNLSSLS